ncbi:MAG TPA: ABC transporter permease [Luteitalea sp.]|nr:ABC transporter permease [Luteitalea sp.]
MTGYLRDLLHATRGLAKASTFTAVCVTSLGLGMSVVIGIMLFMRTMLGTPPGVQDDGLVELVVRVSGQLRAQTGSDIVDHWSYPDYLDVRDAARGVTTAGWSRGEGLFRATSEASAVPLATAYVSSNYFATLGVPLALGPGFTRADDASVAPAEAVLGHRTWQLRFNGDPTIVGRPILVNRSEFVVVGVAPPRFRGHIGDMDEPHDELWLPLSRHPRLTVDQSARADRSTGWIRMIGRLSSDASLVGANASVQAMMATLAAQHPATNRERSASVEPYIPVGARMRAEVAFGKLVIFAMSAMVLLVVGLNVSGMMLVRGAIRQRDTAIRHAVGASRWRLVRYHLAESLVVALLGGAFASTLLFVGPPAIAWGFGVWGTWLDLFRPDAWLAVQCVALCFVASLVLGVLPAIRFSRPSIITALKNDSAGGGRRVGRLQRMTAAAQAGLAVPLLVMAGVQFDQARVAAGADVGFEPKGLYAASLNLAAIAQTNEERRQFLQTAQDTLGRSNGVTVSSVGDGVPLDFIYRNARLAREGDATFTTVHTTRVAPGYLETIGTRMLAGRAIDAGDRADAERVVVLSAPLAQQLFPAGDALGQRIAIARTADQQQTFTVVGISADLVSTQMGNPRPQLFLSLAQEPAESVMLLARGNASDAAIRDAFRNAVIEALRATSSRMGPDDVFREVSTGERLIENSRSDFLTSSGVAGLAAGVALVLTALGVYGVIAFMVATRTREIGVRVALGATRARVLRGVLGQALTLVVPGITGGMLLAVAWVRLTDPAWYPLGGVEPLVYAFAATTALFVATLAGIPSAHRAAAVQPIVAMKAE